jgi:3-hydroxy acid dehydrogenase / malonic semialdehyde reductase
VSAAVDSLSGKTAIVTGASSGIGAATVRALRDAGARVAGGARRVEEIDADLALELDVTDPDGCAAFVTRVISEFGGLDILVNNAGLALGREPFASSTEEDERTVLETNVNGVVRMTRLCLPQLQNGGHIVNLGSVAAIWPYEKGTLYCLSKAAVHAFSRALREDLLGQPIRVTTIAPGLVETDFSRVRFGGDEEKAHAVYANVALGGPMRADDVADCILFAVTRPPNVNVDEIVVMALAQASGARILRD